MNLSFPIIRNLPETAKSKWQRQFVETGRKRHEGVWRRTQEPATRLHSGYRSNGDARWKLVHFFDEYDLVPDNGGYCLVLQKPYIWVNTALPEEELQSYYEKVRLSLKEGGWDIIENNGDLSAQKGALHTRIKFVSKKEAETTAGRLLPNGYRALDVEFFGPEQHLTQEERTRPWKILQGGIRKSLQRGSPRVVSVEDDFNLSPYIPFHLELGCGPSVEAGVPPLSHLHKTYAISNPKTHDFIIGKDDDLLVRLFRDPEAFYLDASLLYASAMKATPTTDFYQLVKRLYDGGVVLPPIFTNNYDGLIADLKMDEMYLRKFDDSHLFPEVTFDKRAKALVVVGSHADRRKLQEKARVQGLQVIYVDPQRYKDDTSGDAYSYGLEAPQDSDILLNMTAQNFADKFGDQLLNGM